MVVRELTGGVHTAGFILTDILYKLPFFFFFNQHLTYLWQESISGSQGASGPMKVVKRSVSIPRCILHLRYLRILLNAASEVLSYLASSSPWSRKTRTLYPSWALISNFD